MAADLDVENMPSFQTCVDLLTRVLDFDRAWRAAVWIIDSQSQSLLASEMKSGFVQVSSMQVGRPRVWDPSCSVKRRRRNRRARAGAVDDTRPAYDLDLDLGPRTRT